MSKAKRAKFVQAVKRETPKVQMGTTKTGIDKARLDRVATKNFFKSRMST